MWKKTKINKKRPRLAHLKKKKKNTLACLGGSPDLVVIGGDSCWEGCGFETLHRILDGNFFTLICCKICNDVCLKRPKINIKRGRGWPILKTLAWLLPVVSSLMSEHWRPTCTWLLAEGQRASFIGWKDGGKKEVNLQPIPFQQILFSFN